MTIHPPHGPSIQEILGYAGLSKNSELTQAEYAGCSRALEYLNNPPGASRDTIYRIIRPRRNDE